MSWLANQRLRFNDRYPSPSLAAAGERLVAATGLPLHQLLIAAQVTSPAAPLFDAPGAWAYVIAQVEQGTSQGAGTERASTPPADRTVEQWAADLAAGDATVRDLCVWYFRSVAPDGIRSA